MEKAYDPKGLVEKLKEHGLDIAEDSAKILVNVLFEWYEESAKLSPSPYDDMTLVVLPIVKSNILKAIDKIDGQEG